MFIYHFYKRKIHMSQNMYDLCTTRIMLNKSKLYYYLHHYQLIGNSDN
jgi:hypothetical protein